MYYVQAHVIHDVIKDDRDLDLLLFTLYSLRVYAPSNQTDQPISRLSGQNHVNLANDMPFESGVDSKLYLGVECSKDPKVYSRKPYFHRHRFHVFS
jgi:hypothetical protein